MDPTTSPPHLFRSQSENTALSTTTFNRLQDSSRPASQQAASAKMDHLASKQYVEQHRAFVEHQRQLHDEERMLWQVERGELHERIHELEHLVRSLGGQVENTFQPSHRGSSVSTHASEQLSTVSSTTSTGEEFWRGTGGLSGAQPTRTFTETSTARPSSTSANTHHLPSIAERPELAPRKKSVEFSAGQPSVISQDFYVHPIPTVSARRRASELDGITFKPSILAASKLDKPPRSESQSPKHGQSHDMHDTPMERVPSSEAREAKPQMIDMPGSGLTASALLVKDAGHTPLARMADPESESSAVGTPKLQPQEAIAENGEAVLAKVPSEKSQSYFPVIDEAAQLPPLEEQEVQNGEPADDPALKGPLSLTNDPNSQENSGFLGQLNSKLLEAQKAAEALAAAEDRNGDTHTAGQPDAAALDAEEQEPKLKIKRSMNFGSVFGSASVGRNV